eukprot:scaffold31781_cov152-Isochrysis_galbana.AAC.1
MPYTSSWVTFRTGSASVVIADGPTSVERRPSGSSCVLSFAWLLVFAPRAAGAVRPPPMGDKVELWICIKNLPSVPRIDRAVGACGSQGARAGGLVSPCVRSLLTAGNPLE